MSLRFLLVWAVLAACQGPVRAADPAPAAPTVLASGGIAIGGAGKVNLFEARAVPVDATAASVTEARERAFTDGRVAALQVVLERLAAHSDVAKMPQLAANDVIDMVQEFSVSNERTSAVRYLADLTVRFNADAVRRVLRAAHIPFSEVVSKPMVVLPVYVDGGAVMLWDNGNPWRDAFLHLQTIDSLVPLVLPAGDAEDAHLTASQINARDAAALTALASRYDAAGVVIVKASGGNPGSDVQITLTEVRGLAPPTDAVLSSPAAPGQSRDDVLAAAAKAAVDAISDGWKRQSRLEAKQVLQITALAALTDIKDWIRIRDALKDVPLVSKVELQAITRDRAQVSLRYEGDPAKLEMSFAQQGLVANQDGTVWMISLPHASAATPAAAPAVQ